MKLLLSNKHNGGAYASALSSALLSRRAMYDQYKDEEPNRVVQVSKETGISAIDEPGYNIMLNTKAETTPVSPKVVIKNRSNY
jgi:hypothetical protein